ncbi:MAG: TrkH family potassium uptake protein [Pirellulaceae bacterium]
MKTRTASDSGSGATRWRRNTQVARSSLRQRKLAPAELFIGSFFALIMLGTLSLKVMPGLYRGQALTWSDAVFTATSAVCVTGLIVVETATYFTFAGQAVILLLIQLGGLGMLVLTSVIIIALGGRPSFRSETVAVGSRHLIPHVSSQKLILDIVRFTFFFEAVGAVLLYFVWAPRLGWGNALWPAIFHSVSAFCNAGFSTNTFSLMEFHDSPITIVVISLLIVTGGLGFVTMKELYETLVSRKSREITRLSLHSRLVLATTAALIIAGWLLFALFEWQGVLASMPMGDKFANALFMSITPRTAGFNTIDYGQASDSTNLLTIILMMIGGSPGSTAGGMKTTTFALLMLLAWSRLRSHATATFARRSIPDETIQRGTGLFVIATGIVVLGVFALTFYGDFFGPDHGFLARLFETVSAFNTVGLSMGITPELSAPSRWVLIVMMFAGRTGPLAIAAALIVRLAQRGKFRLAYEDVIVG